MRHRGCCARAAHLGARVLRRASDATRIGLRDMRRHGRPREARCFMPACHGLLHAWQGSPRAIHVRQAALRVGKALLTRWALRNAGACPPFGDRRARLGPADTRGPLGRDLRGKASVRLPVAAPIGAAVIPGPTRVVARPVRVQHERHDRHVDDIDIVRQIDVPLAVEIFQILRRNPAAVAGPADVAPGVAPDTAVNIDVGASGNAIDRRKALPWPCPHADGCGDNARRRKRGGGRQQHCCNENSC